MARAFTTLTSVHAADYVFLSYAGLPRAMTVQEDQMKRVIGCV